MGKPRKIVQFQFVSVPGYTPVLLLLDDDGVLWQRDEIYPFPNPKPCLRLPDKEDE